jgi:hypothetical protein
MNAAEPLYEENPKCVPLAGDDAQILCNCNYIMALAK